MTRDYPPTTPPPPSGPTPAPMGAPPTAPWRFWVVTVAAVVVVATTFSLGQWQLRRAAQKEALQAAIQSSNTLPPMDTAALAARADLAGDVYRPVTARGRWDAAHTVFLDNRAMGERAGFWVMTPLVLDGVAAPAGRPVAVLVQRGWAPRNFADRTRLPEVATPDGLVTVQGRIAPPPSKLYEFKGAEPGRIRQNLDLDAFRTETGLALAQGTLLQLGAPGDGLLRDWAPPQLGIEKHYGYAVQWFLLCGLAAGLYLWFQWLQPLRRRQRARPDSPSSGSSVSSRSSPSET